jgi:hypothetical protein
MEYIEVKLDFKKVQDAIKKQLEEVCGSSYNSPIRKVVEDSLKGQEGSIKLMVDDIIKNAIGTEEFKKQMSDLVIHKLVEQALKR